MRKAMVLIVAAALAGGALAAEADAEALKRLWGDWEGSWKGADGKEHKLAAQVIDWGKDGYQANVLQQFDTREPAIVVLKGTLDKGKLASFTCWNGDPFDLGSYPVSVYGEGEQVYSD